ncbi:hypothetical protein Tsubulata_015954 [Turnera subulata]|uniref:Uncharacterized protein n=1 Tax=Turnera subulata TaxID=218843 RepID=A0A9Q0FZG0_9ROSI|nr:hypothetical protein Tsubulata_015954 [Turnera subulata]
MPLIVDVPTSKAVWDTLATNYASPSRASWNSTFAFNTWFKKMNPYLIIFIGQNTSLMVLQLLVATLDFNLYVLRGLRALFMLAPSLFHSKNCTVFLSATSSFMVIPWQNWISLLLCPLLRVILCKHSRFRLVRTRWMLFLVSSRSVAGAVDVATVAVVIVTTSSRGTLFGARSVTDLITLRHNAFSAPSCLLHYLQLICPNFMCHHLLMLPMSLRLHLSPIMAIPLGIPIVEQRIMSHPIYLLLVLLRSTKVLNSFK